MLLDTKKHAKARIIAIFVGAYDEKNWFLYNQRYDPGEMFTWLEKTLQESEANNEDVFILKHIPVGPSTNHAANKHL